MAGSLPRAGALLVLAGVAAVAAGLLLGFVGDYGEFSHLALLNTSSFRFYEQLVVISFFLLATGVLLVGVGWSLTQPGSSSPGNEGSYAVPPGRALGIPLVIAGAAVVAAGSLFVGLIEEEGLSGRALHLPGWSSLLSLLFAGLGLLVWGAGWFLSKMS